jgi:DNA polymerase III delta prime subunit
MTLLTNTATNHLFERYRPKRIADCVLLPRDRKFFESFIAKKNAPHLLLVGPPGVGKTTVGMALAADMNWQMTKKNAAAYTNIEAVRNEIAALATCRPGLLEALYGVPEPLVCILLEEADHIPIKAQAAMRGMMEDAAAMQDGGTFILTANDGSKIDPAIRSRCAVFDFCYDNSRDREIIKDGYRARITEILEAEGMEADPGMIDRLIERHFPDLRGMLNEMQLHV